MFTSLERLNREPITSKERQVKLGFICDIDETIADSWPGWIKRLNEHFSTDFTPEYMARFGLIQNCPDLKRLGPPFFDYVNSLRHDQEFNLELPPIEGAMEGLTKMAQFARFKAYVTARPESIYIQTLYWLHHYGFQSAPVICRPKSIDYGQAKVWKAKVIRNAGADILIDDDARLANMLSQHIAHIILIKPPYKQAIDKLASNIITAQDWGEIVEVAGDLSREHNNSRKNALAKLV